MKILVTGASGFVGGYLIKDLLNRQHTVAAVVRNNSDVLKRNSVCTHELDILDFDAVKDCLVREQPDVVIHLAAQSSVAYSWQNPVVTMDINVKGTINIVKVIGEFLPNTKLVNVGSSDEYGLTARQGGKLTEDLPCLPQNPYSISKLCAEQMALKLAEKYGIVVVQVRPFNHFGPGQRKGFVISDFASQIAAIEQGLTKPVLKVGDLSASRDFSFVGDIVRAYRLLSEENIKSDVYNVCSGTSIRISDVLSKLISLAKVKIEVVVDESKFRTAEVPDFAGDAAKIFNAVKWQTEENFDSALEQTLDWWRMVSL